MFRSVLSKVTGMWLAPGKSNWGNDAGMSETLLKEMEIIKTFFGKVSAKTSCPVCESTVVAIWAWGRRDLLLRSRSAGETLLTFTFKTITTSRRLAESRG